MRYLKLLLIPLAVIIPAELLGAILAFVLTGSVLPPGSRPDQMGSGPFVIGSRGRITDSTRAHLEREAQALFRTHQVRVLTYFQGTASRTNTLGMDREALDGLRHVGNLDKLIGLYPPTVVCVFTIDPSGEKTVNYEFSPNYWYADWDGTRLPLRVPGFDALVTQHVAAVRAHARTRIDRGTLTGRLLPPVAVRLCLVLLLVVPNLLWMPALLLRVCDGRPRVRGALFLEGALWATLTLALLSLLAYLAGWPELTVSRAVLLGCVVGTFLTAQAVRVTGRLHSSVLLVGSLLVWIGWAFLSIRLEAAFSAPLYSAGEHLLLDCLKAGMNTVPFGLGIYLSVAAAFRPQFAVLGERPTGLLGGWLSRGPALDDFLCLATGKIVPQADTGGEPPLTRVRRVLAESSLGNVYCLSILAVGAAAGLARRVFQRPARDQVSTDHPAHAACHRSALGHTLGYFHLICHCLPEAERQRRRGAVRTALAVVASGEVRLESLRYRYPRIGESAAARRLSVLRGKLCLAVGDIDGARSSLLGSLGAERPLPDPDEVDTRLQLARLARGTGADAEASDHLRSSRERLLRIERRYGSLWTVYRCGSLGQQRHALSRLMRTLQNEDPAGAYSRLNALAPLLATLPARKAEQIYESSLLGRASTETGEEDDWSAALPNTEGAVSDLHRLQEALRLAAASAAGPASDLFGALDPAAPQSALPAALGTLSLGGLPPDPVTAYDVEVSAWIARNEGVRRLPAEPQGALVLLGFALERYRALGRTDAIADVHLRISEAALLRDHPKLSLVLARSALTIAQDNGHVQLEHDARVALGRTYRALDRPEDACHQFSAAIEGIEIVRSRILNPDRRSLYASAAPDACGEQVLALLQMGRVAAAVEYAERGKARTLLELLGNHHVRVRGNADRTLISQDEQLQQRLQSLLQERWEVDGRLREIGRRKLAKGGLDSAASAEAEKARNRLRSLADEQSETTARLAETKRRIRETCAEWASLRAVPHLALDDPARADDLRRQLARHFAGSGERVAVLEYFVHEEGSWLFVIPGWEGHEPAAVAFELGIGRAELAGIADEGASAGARLIPDGLYERLLAPARAYLEELGATALVFVPHGPLHALPLHALHWHDVRLGLRFLVEDYPCAYLPSLSVVQFLTGKRRGAAEGFCVLGNPDPPGDLPAAGREALAVADLLGARPLLGAEATKQALLSRAPEAGILHLACHAAFVAVDPLQSHLVLSSGLLTADEVLDLELRASLVTLSACSTAAGSLTRGDEFAAMARAWLYAGTPSVIASLWIVREESAPETMASFYAHWRKGATKMRALQAAQREWLERRRAALDDPRDAEMAKAELDPYLWASFVLIGDAI